MYKLKIYFFQGNPGKANFAWYLTGHIPLYSEARTKKADILQMTFSNAFS